MDDEIQDALDESTDEPPQEVVVAETDARVMPPLGQQLDEAGRAHSFVTSTVATASKDDMEATLSVANGQGLLVEFPGGERVLFPTGKLFSTAATAVGESDFGPDLDV